MSQGDVHKAFTQVSGDIDQLRRTLTEYDNRKVDKKELNETKIKIMAALDMKAENSGIQSSLSAISGE